MNYSHSGVLFSIRAASDEQARVGGVEPPPLPPKKQLPVAKTPASESNSSFEGEVGALGGSTGTTGGSTSEELPPARQPRHHRHQLDWFSNPLFQSDAKGPQTLGSEWSEVKRQRSSDDLLEVGKENIIKMIFQN